MENFDYSYYRDRYCGMLDEALFSRFAPTACDVVSLLVGTDCEKSSDTRVLRAMCLECDYLERLSRDRMGVKSESLGDYSVSYSDEGEIGGSFSFGCPVSGEVIAALTRAGLLTRWA